IILFFFSSRRRHTRFSRDWSSDVCSSDLNQAERITATAEYQRYRHQLALWLGDPAWLQPEAGNIAADAAALPLLTAADQGVALRSEERRVGKEGRSRWAPEP